MTPGSRPLRCVISFQPTLGLHSYPHFSNGDSETQYFHDSTIGTAGKQQNWPDLPGSEAPSITPFCLSSFLTSQSCREGSRAGNLHTQVLIRGWYLGSSLPGELGSSPDSPQPFSGPQASICRMGVSFCSSPRSL